MTDWIHTLAFPKRPPHHIRGFVTLFLIGLVICLPKLARPMGYEKQIYLQVSRWLSENTPPNAVVACPDMRIPFYAQREWIRRKWHADYAILFYTAQEPPSSWPDAFIPLKQFQWQKGHETEIIEVFQVPKSRSEDEGTP